MEHEVPLAEKLDLNFATNKDDQGFVSCKHRNEAVEDDVVQMDAMKEDTVSRVMPDFASNEGDEHPINNFSTPVPQSPLNKAEGSSFALESEMHPDDIEVKTYAHRADGVMSIDEYHYHGQQKVTEYDHSGEVMNVNARGNSRMGGETESSDAFIQEPLSALDDQNGLDLKASDDQAENLHSFGDTADGEVGNMSKDSLMETEPFKQKMDEGSFDHQDEMNEEKYPPGMVPSDNREDDGGIAMKQCSMASQKTRDGTPSPEVQFTREVSPHNHPSERQPEITDSNKKLAYSPNSSRHKRSTSAEKPDLGRKRASSHERSPPSARRRSPSGRTSRRDSHHREYSPRKHLSRSPRHKESPRRKEKSLSRSPVRGRDSSGHRRDHRGKSRSRSPYPRNRHRRSPRYSPRRRSSPSSYHSRRRSPRRPWSPPANRSTGIGKPGRNLFVAGFSYGTSERDLEKKFSRFGRVTDVRIVRDRRSGDSRGFGFLSLERDEDADAAIRALDQTEWNSRIILVEKSKTSVR